MAHMSHVDSVSSSIPRMDVSELPNVAQARAVKLQSNADERGDLSIFYHRMGWLIRIGIDFSPVQVMVSRSKANVLRGMHSQARSPQAKFVTCVSGRVLDCVYDARQGSPTFGRYELVMLEGPDQAVYVPSGCLHGYYAFEDSVVLYAVDRLYDPASDGGARWDALGIEWPSCTPIVSAKDQKLGTFDEWEHFRSSFYPSLFR